jgi:hypothetical protein
MTIAKMTVFRMTLNQMHFAEWHSLIFPGWVTNPEPFLYNFSLSAAEPEHFLG